MVCAGGVGGQRVSWAQYITRSAFWTQHPVLAVRIAGVYPKLAPARQTQSLNPPVFQSVFTYVYKLHIYVNILFWVDVNDQYP